MAVVWRLEDVDGRSGRCVRVYVQVLLCVRNLLVCQGKLEMDSLRPRHNDLDQNLTSRGFRYRHILQLDNDRLVVRSTRNSRFLHLEIC